MLLSHIRFIIADHSEIPITAKMVSQLRAKTDSPMMECKKALIEAKGDFDRAEEILRVKLGNKATKVGSRIAAEGSEYLFILVTTSDSDPSYSSYLRTNTFLKIVNILPLLYDMQGWLSP